MVDAKLDRERVTMRRGNVDGVADHAVDCRRGHAAPIGGKIATLPNGARTGERKDSRPDRGTRGAP
jgi:hypothetical protein